MKIKIYGLYSGNNTDIRYIGKTKQHLSKRLYSHIRDSIKNNKTYKDRWVNKCIKEREGIKIILLDEVEECEWEFWERWYISYFKSIGVRLTNNTNGGEHGLVKTLDTKNKLSKISKELWRNGVLNTNTNIKNAVKTKKINILNYNRNFYYKAINIITKEELKFPSIPEIAKYINCNTRRIDEVLRGFKNKGNGRISKVNSIKGYKIIKITNNKVS